MILFLALAPACQSSPLPAGDDSGTPVTQLQAPCFDGLGDGFFPDYSALGIHLPAHCHGTDLQKIDGIQRLVFLGDSVTAGTPPTPGDETYRAVLTAALTERYGPALEVSDCSEWGARTDDLLMHEGRQIPLCFPEGGSELRTLVVMTVGGNDMLAAAGTSDAQGPTAAQAELTGDLALLDQALAWFKGGSDPASAHPEDSTRFPNGVFVVMGNVYEFTDGTGDLDSCALASALGFGGKQPKLVQGYGFVDESYMQLAVRWNVDLTLMLENFCGHGFHAGEPGNLCYRGEDAETWFDASCIHPNPTGHAQLAQMFLDTIEN